MITNDFKIKSKSKGFIYTYSVDFLEAGQVAGASSFKTVKEQEEALAVKSSSNQQPGKGALETFQKFKIMN